MAQTLQPIVINEYPDWPDRSLDVAPENVSAAAVVPMKYGNKLIGVIGIYKTENGDRPEFMKYSQEDANLLEVFADTVAVAINNAILFKETQQRLLEIQVLYKTSLASVQINSIRTIAQQIVETLEQLMGWKNSSIWLIDHKNNQIKQIAHSNTDGYINEIRFTEGQTFDLMSTGNLRVVDLVCSSGQPILNGKVDKTSGYLPDDTETKSVLCVPLISSGKTIGCINIESQAAHDFGAHDQQILATLAAQAASAIENANLYQDAIHAAERRSILHQATQEIARSSLDPEDVFLAVHNAATQLMPADVFVITILDEPKQEIRGVYLIARGVRYPGIKFHVGQGISSKVITSGKSILVPDFLISRQEIEPVVFSSEGMTRSILAVPMRAGERITGMISVQSYEPNKYIDEDTALLEMLAAHAGAAIENARLFEETRRRAVHQAVLNSIISVTAHAGSEPAEILSTTLEQTLSALNMEMGSLWLSWSARGSQRLTSKNIPASINSSYFKFRFDDWYPPNATPCCG